MPKIRRAIVTVAALLVVLAAVEARAEDVAAKKILVKEHPDTTKRQVQVQSDDDGIQLSEADDPATNGASVHVYSATDDLCIVLPSGSDWSTNGKLWKFKNKATKNQAQIADGKLKVKLKSNVDFTLADDGSQGAVNVQVQFGDLGTRYCMRCSGNKADDAKKFIGTGCAAVPCDAEPITCDPNTTTTTLPQVPGVELQGVLAITSGRFNYNLVIGVPGADAACASNWPGTHTCTITELQTAEAAGDLDGIKDLNNITVTSFWAIDPTRPDVDQCTVTTDWDYNTAHTGQFADRVALDNPNGTLSAISSGVLCSGSSWVGCCL